MIFEDWPTLQSGSGFWIDYFSGLESGFGAGGFDGLLHGGLPDYGLTPGGDGALISLDRDDGPVSTGVQPHQPFLVDDAPVAFGDVASPASALSETAGPAGPSFSQRMLFEALGGGSMARVGGWG